MIQLEGRSFIILTLSLVFNIKIVRLIKMCPNEIYSTDWVGKYLSHVMFLIKNDLTQ